MAGIREAVTQAVEAAPNGDEGQPRLQLYLDAISAYEREYKKWEQRVDKILKRYRDEGRDTKSSTQARFNILWSNVQTLVPACFSRLPQPDVSRRFRDNDPVGRVASLILERALEFEVQHYPDYRQTMKQSVHDRFLGGRGASWARYEPKFKPAEQITEDSDEEQAEELDYECAPTDYVHWKDFGHSVARTWEEVTLVWRKVYLNESAVAKRFGADMAKKVPYDATPDDLKRANRENQAPIKKQACIYELWDKDTGKAVWLNKSMTKEFLDERDDPLGLQDFFPCPRPLYATMSNESLVPVPDFTLYQDQAQELDILSDRIDGLARMLQVKGVYDASADPAVARLFTEGENGTLLPIKNWAAFAEKNGLKGQLDVMDLTMIAKALEQAYLAMEQVKNQVYEITGISDIIRGQSEASETATAQQIKGQYASLRLRSMQDEVARYATEILQLKAQIICGKFNPQVIQQMAAVDQLTPEDQEHVPAAMVLLVGEQRLVDPEAESPNPMRSFRISIAADTLVEIDEQSEKESRMEMLQAFGAYLKQASEVGAVAPAMIPLVVEVGKFGLQAFKVGKAIEGTFDSALDALKQQVASGQMMPPEVQKQMEEQQQQLQQGAEELAKKDEELKKREADQFQKETQHQVERVQFDAEKQVFQQEQKMAAEQQKIAQERQDMAGERMGMDVERQQFGAEKERMTADAAKKDAERAGQEIEAKKTDSAEIEARNERMEKLVLAVIESNQELGQSVAQLAKAIASPKRIKRGADGRAEGVETVQ